MNYEQLLAQYRAGGTLTLDQLRFLFGEMTTRAEAMPGLITAETPAADAERIERDHTAALAELESVRGRITASEEAAAAAALVTPPTAELRAAMVAERGRITAIQEDGRHFGQPDAFIQRHIAEGTEATAFRLAILDNLRTNSERNPVFSHAAQITRDEGDTRRDGMAQAIVHNMAVAAGERNLTAPSIAQQWVGRSLVDLAAECIDYRGRGRFLNSRDADEIFTRAMLSTSDFPGIFTNALNVRLLARYQTAAPTYRRWAALYTAPDFRQMNVIRAGDFPTLQPVNETGEIKSGSFGESKEVFQVAAYAVMLNISRQMMINDRLNAIEQVLGSAGARVADWENAKMYAILLSGASSVGPTLLTDGVAVFNAASHGNLAGTPAAITIASVGLARAAMMKQTTIDGLKGNFQPATLLVGPDKQMEADQLFTSIFATTIGTAVPQSYGTMVPVADANIPGNGWYLFADPMTAPCFVYGFLEGFEGPRLASEQEFDVQGMRIKLEHDFGGAAIDFRGGFRNAGA